MYFYFKKSEATQIVLRNHSCYEYRSQRYVIRPRPDGCAQDSGHTTGLKGCDWLVHRQN